MEASYLTRLFLLSLFIVYSTQSLTAPVNTLRIFGDTSGFAGGNGWIARTENAGKTWNQQATISNVKQIYSLNSTFAWASAGVKKPYSLYSTTDGTSWSRTGTVPTDGYLHFDDATTGLCGNAISFDSGTSWTFTSIPINATGEILYVNSTLGWAVNSSDSILNFLRTNNGGKKWEIVYSRTSTVPATNVVIRHASAINVWFLIYGDYGMEQQSYSLFHTIDSGETWIAVLNDDTAGGGPAPGFSRSGGAYKNAAPSPGPLTTAYFTNTVFLGGNCLGCDDGGNSLGTSNDGGRNWTNLPKTFPGDYYPTPQVISAVDPMNVWQIINDEVSPSVLYVSKDGGKTWITSTKFSH